MHTGQLARSSARRGRRRRRRRRGGGRRGGRPRRRRWSMYACMHMYAYVCMYACMHCRPWRHRWSMYACICMHVCMHMHVYACMYVCICMQAMEAQVQRHARLYMHAHAHAHTHAHAQVELHAQLYMHMHVHMRRWSYVRSSRVWSEPLPTPMPSWTQPAPRRPPPVLRRSQLRSELGACWRGRWWRRRSERHCSVRCLLCLWVPNPQGHPPCLRRQPRLQPPLSPKCR